MNEEEKYVFISYAHKDFDEVGRLVASLEHVACNIWFDNGIEKGAQWSEDIALHLLNAECVLWFVSKASIESKYVMGEINFAISRDKRIIPVYIEDVQMPLGVELLLGQIQAVYLSGIEKYAEKRKSLIAALPKSVFFEAAVPFFASGSNVFFLSDTSVEFPENAYFAGELHCSYEVGFSSTGTAEDQTRLFGFRAAPAYDMNAKITSVIPVKDKYLKEIDDSAVVFNISLSFMGKYPVPWPDIDAALTLVIYDADGSAPEFKLLGGRVVSVNGKKNAEEKEYNFARNTIDEIVKQICGK